MKFTKEYTDQPILKEAAERNPEMLIGGFLIDAVVLALHHALISEDIPEADIQRRITAGLTAAYKGIV